ncbi:hypothetical protein [Thermosinus carboxydivorans]|uniref:hypothetical protein n=1 Tax=Thermosinus carboxydivorans TaxID=261685 RepID=UPI00030C570C|nr:hypothetical protein [Thermosinus carboxydivorans]
MAKNHIRYAGAGFQAKVSPSRINRFVRALPEKKRQSLFSVAEELKSAGLIETTGEITHSHAENIDIDK